METVETSQSTTAPVEQKSTDWIKIILTAVLGFGLLAGSAYAGYYYGTQQVQEPETPSPVASQPRPEADRPLDETPTPTPPIEDESNQIRKFLTSYMDAVVAKDWKTVKGYLTEGVREDFVETAAPSGVESYEILSVSGPDEDGRYLSVVRCYGSGGDVITTPIGDPQLLVIKENGQWKTLTWYLYQ